MSTTKEFSIPVSMAGTPEQLEYVAGELEKVGYERINWNTGDTSRNTLVTNLYNQSHHFSNSLSGAKNLQNRHFIPSYNPDLCLALAAACKNDTWQFGEWCIRCSDNSWQFVDALGGIQLESVKAIYRRPSLAEFIEHFSTTDMQTEKQRKIIGYKAPIDLYGGIIKKGDLFIQCYNPNHYEPKTHPGTTDFNMPAEIVEQWEPEYEPEVREVFKNHYVEAMGEVEHKTKEDAVINRSSFYVPLAVFKFTYTGDELTGFEMVHNYITEGK